METDEEKKLKGEKVMQAYEKFMYQNKLKTSNIVSSANNKTSINNY